MSHPTLRRYEVDYTYVGTEQGTQTRIVQVLEDELLEQGANLIRRILSVADCATNEYADMVVIYHKERLS